MRKGTDSAKFIFCLTIYNEECLPLKRLQTLQAAFMKRKGEGEKGRKGEGENVEA